MLEKFYRLGGKKNHWRKGDRILLAISGGLDSMILLFLMCRVAEKTGCTVGVAHVNHQLRPESDEEERYLEAFCRENQLAFYSKRWEENLLISSVEVRAREFRYTFFKSIMEKESFNTLMTAHHMDDQAETILMRLTRGSTLRNLVGIREEQSFGSGRLIRPLLIFSKDELKVFAKEQNIVYFEDSSNHSDLYFRNRVRHHVVPYLKEENRNFLEHISTFSHQVDLVDELIQEITGAKYKEWVKKIDTGWQLDLSVLQNESRSFRYFFLQFFLQKTLVEKNIAINKEQLETLYNILAQSDPQKVVMLEKGWRFIKEYNTAFLVQETTIPTVEFSLPIGEGIFLSDTEWLGLSSFDRPVIVPERIKAWEAEERLLSVETKLPLKVRHRNAGDRIALTPFLTKRLNRLFIDRKIPNSSRENAWVILTDRNEILWVPKFANSHLSIPEETDKIHYRLLYKTKG
ncbi:tRNA lysidine(34) synthetase TilS [Candidatus Enterococcus clewellii]|uniref:tRNA(Ile)-lysidine synthase n=1 Tax=Candidatus Enterococcus clewellii TaxID=1834193 RepID=A0A242JXC5_9ENTE|nr:tRNA lysidine(34) synthetase TilS [Enterococcus sp. 9E7_DIV0242]OTP09882.1 tRNA(Ile)-lysidine synthetase [Enterococcus sp. 9E7_DIV0242]